MKKKFDKNSNNTIKIDKIQNYYLFDKFTERGNYTIKNIVLRRNMIITIGIIIFKKFLGRFKCIFNGLNWVKIKEKNY